MTPRFSAGGISYIPHQVIGKPYQALEKAVSTSGSSDGYPAVMNSAQRENLTRRRHVDLARVCTAACPCQAA
jgi:hypothetical protein